MERVTDLEATNTHNYFTSKEHSHHQRDTRTIVSQVKNTVITKEIYRPLPAGKTEKRVESQHHNERTNKHKKQNIQDAPPHT